MNKPLDPNNDSSELEALFDGIVAAGAASAMPASGAADAPATPPVAAGGGAERVINRVGQLTRQLHENLRELGYGKLLESAAVSVPFVPM